MLDVHCYQKRIDQIKSLQLMETVAKLERHVRNLGRIIGKLKTLLVKYERATATVRLEM